MAAKALGSLNIDLGSLRTQVENTIGRGNAKGEAVGYTPRAKKVIELSMEEAQKLGHNYIGTEHLLLGLIREGEGVAAQMLTSMGADITVVRQRVIELLGGFALSGQAPQPKAGESCSCQSPSRQPLSWMSLAGILTSWPKNIRLTR